jgi:hypothetical protein
MASGSAGAGPKDESQAGYVEQYKAYMADLASLGSRYSTSQSFYFTMVAALLGVIAVKTDGSLGKTLTPVFAVVMLFIAGICYVWRSEVLFYNGLFYKKFTVLKELEQKAHLHPAFSREAEITEQDGRPLPVPALTTIQAGVPLLIGSGALILAIVALYYLASNS